MEYIPLISGFMTIIASIIGYLLKKQIEDVSLNLKELAVQKTETRERIIKLEVNYDNLISTIHELSTLIENTQEAMNDITNKLNELKLDVKGIKRG